MNEGVLVVEEARSVREIATVPDGRQGLEEVAGHRFDLMVLDRNVTTVRGAGYRLAV